MSKKKQRKYKAIENIEDGIKAYLFINAVLEQYEAADHPHAKLGVFVAKATLNELLSTYETHNGPQALQTLADRITDNSGDDSKVQPAGLPSV